MFFLPFFYLYIIQAQRWDYIATVHQIGGQTLGLWQSDVMCPPGSWARGYQHCTDLSSGYLNDDSGTNTIRFYCYDYSGKLIGKIDSNPPIFGNWSSIETCDGFENFIIGYQLKVYTADTSYGVTSAKIMCSDHNSKNTNIELNIGAWQGWGICPSGTAVCGQKSRFLGYQGTYGDDSALNDLMVYCCRLCDEENARYINPSNLNCEECHYTCKTCSGPGPSECKSCFHSDGLTSGSCPGPSNLFEVAKETPPYAWTGSITSSCGIFTQISGGFNIFGKTQYIVKSFSNIPPYFKKRLRVRYIAIDSLPLDCWTVSIDVNGLIFKSAINQWDRGFLYGDQCGLSDYNEYALMFELETSSDKNAVTFPIKIFSGLGNSNSNGWWGIASFYLGVLKCDVTCKSCKGPNFNECEDCYPNASLQADFSCACGITFFAVSNIPCTSYPCTTCTPCYSGCKTCSGAASTQCSSCMTGFYFYENSCYNNRCPSPKCGNNDTLTCDDTCKSSSQYIDSTDRICKLICPSPSWGWESDRKCKGDCPSANYYKEFSNRVCSPCHPECETCRGPNSDDCLSCSGSRYLSGTMCLSDCLVGKYGSSTSHTCMDCNEKCKTCESPDNPDKCLSCYLSYYLKTNKCEPSCSSNEYKDFVNGKCEACHSSCASCFSGLSTNCLSCSGSLYLYELNSSCLSSCPSPYFAATNLCVKTCSLGQYGETITRTCGLTPCLSGEYADPSDRICKKCHSDCLTCNGPASSNCQSCQGLRYLRGNSCVFDCGRSYFGKTAFNSNTCEPCTNNCSSCMTPDGPSQCSGCGVLLGVTYFLKSTECTPICPIPLWGRPETFTCETTCLKTNQFGHPESRKCYDCPINCSTCDQSGCLTCPSYRYFSQKDCLLCGPAYWTFPTSDGKNRCIKCSDKEEYLITQKECMKPYSLIEGTCYRCPENCLQCLYPGDICSKCIANTFYHLGSCLFKCPTPFWGNTNLTQWKCQEGCAIGFYVTLANRTCNSCSNTCQSCSGPQETDCLSCYSGHFLNKDGTCKACDIPCLECRFVPGNCSSCPEHMKLFQESVTSSTCIAHICDSNCAKCTGENYCKTCASLDLYFDYVSDKERVCKAKVKVNVSLSQVNNPKVFELGFTEIWEEYFRGMENKIEFQITKLDANMYNCTLMKFGSDPRKFYVTCDYYSNVTNESSISIRLKNYPANTENSSHYLIRDTMEMGLARYVKCENEGTWDESIQMCIKPILVTPFIYLTANPQKLDFGFDNKVPEELDKNISVYTNISIASLNSTQYSANISRKGGASFQYEIFLAFSQEIKNNPVLQVELNLSPSLISNQSLKFMKKSVQIPLMDYYILSAESKLTVENSAEVAKASSAGAGQAFFYSSAVKTGSSFLIKSLIVNQVIHLLRFVKINYPPNVLEIFKAKLVSGSVFPEFDLALEIEDGGPDGIFYQHNMSPYILNNCGSYLLSCYGFFFLAFGIKLISHLFGHFISKHKHLLIIFGSLYDFFVWNFPISFLLSKYQTVTVIVGISLRFPTYRTFKGFLNLLFSCVCLFAVVFLPALIIITIKKIRTSAEIVAIIRDFPTTLKRRNSFKLISQIQHESSSPLSNNHEKVNEEDNSEILNKKKSSDLKGFPKRHFLHGISLKREISRNEEGEKKEEKSDALGKSNSFIEIEDKTNKPEGDCVTHDSLEMSDDKSDINEKGLQTFHHPSQVVLNREAGDMNKTKDNIAKIDNKEIRLDQLSLKEVPTLDKKKTIRRTSEVLNYPKKMTRAFKVKGTVFFEMFQFFKKRPANSSMDILKERKKSFSELLSPKKPGNINRDLDKIKRNFHIFHSDYNVDRAISHYYMLFEVIRQLLVSMIILCINDIPLLQIILIFSLNVLFFLSILKLRPYSNKKAFIQNCVFEVLLIFTILGFLILAILDSQGNKDLELRMNVGWWICINNIVIVLIMLLMVFVQIATVIWKLLCRLNDRVIKKKSNRITYN